MPDVEIVLIKYSKMEHSLFLIGDEKISSAPIIQNISKPLRASRE